MKNPTVTRSFLQVKITLRRLFCFASCWLAFGLLPALANDPPVIVSGGAPSHGYQGSFGFLTEWIDPDGDFVVDVTVRYKQQEADRWTLAVLDFIAGSKPLTFQKNIFINSEPGLYEYQFRASDAETEDGPRIHTTNWSESGVLEVLSGRPGESLGCVGVNPEQAAMSGTTPPSVDIILPDSIEEGATVTLSTQFEVDSENGANSVFFWCANIGTLQMHPNFPNYQSVLYTAPMTPGKNRGAEISVKLSDGLGHIDQAGWGVSILETGIQDSGDPAPQISASAPPEWQVGEPAKIDLDLSDFDSSGKDASRLLVTDFHLMHLETGIRLRSITGVRGALDFYLWKPKGTLAPLAPFNLKIVTTDGNSESEFVVGPIEYRLKFALEGGVLDDDGNSLMGAQLEILETGGNDFTDNHGNFGFLLDGEGAYTVRPSKDGFDFDPPSLTVTLTESKPIDRSLLFVGTSIGVPPPPPPPGGTTLIDIKPGSIVNPINPRSRGKIPVAILSSSTFNAPADVDRETLTFGRTGDEPSLHYRGNGQPNCGDDEDVNGDGFIDLVCHFFTQIAGFQDGDTKGFLKGQTLSGEAFEAMDTITIVGNGFDGDADGVEDEIEDEAPNNGDGNNDGLFDSAQANVTSLRSATTDEFITLVADAPCINTAVQSVNSTTLPGDEGFMMPQGLLSFTLDSCSASDVTVFFSGETDLSTAEYRRFGPTPEDPTERWYSLPTTFSEVTIDEQLVATASFRLEDGGVGDDDLAVNGRIVDPGGPALVITHNIPTLSGAGILGLILLLGGIAFVLLRRKGM